MITSTSNQITFKNSYSPWNQIWIWNFCIIPLNKFFLQDFKKLKLSVLFYWDKVKSPKDTKYFTCTFYICRDPHLSILVKWQMGQQQRVPEVSSAILRNIKHIHLSKSTLHFQTIFSLCQIEASCSVVKNPHANTEDEGSICRLERSPGEGNGSPLQYSCLGNPMDRGASPWGHKRVRHNLATKQQNANLRN